MSNYVSGLIKVYGASGLLGSNIVTQLEKGGYSVDKPTVIHCAAKLDGRYAIQENPYKYISGNANIDLEVIQYCIDYSVYRLIRIGSVVDPNTEDVYKPYALAKTFGDDLLEYAPIPVKLNIKPTSFFGVGQKETHVIPQMIKGMLKCKKDKTVYTVHNPDVIRSFIHAPDLATFVLGNLEFDEMGTYVSPVSGKTLTILSLAKILADIIGVEIRIADTGVVSDRITPFNSLDWELKPTLKKVVEYYM